MTTDYTPKFDLAGKVVLVTGASRGIGRACALACAGSGADMIVGVRSTADGSALFWPAISNALPCPTLENNRPAPTESAEALRPARSFTGMWPWS